MSKVCGFLLVILFSVKSFAYNPITEAQKKALMQEFNYLPQITVTQKPSGNCSGDDLVYDTTYPQSATPYTIEARAYIPSNTQSPLVIMLPPISGINMLDKSMAKTFCKNNIAAIIITNSFTGFDSGKLMPVTEHDEAFRKLVSGVKGALAYASTRSDIDMDKLGIFGVSLGGILSSAAFSVIKDFSAATFLVNGGDIPYIMAYSEQSDAKNIRRLRMKEQGFKTQQEYEEYLKANLRYDPLHFASEIHPDTVKMYLSTADTSVPSIKQKEYYEAIGSPKETQFGNASHVGTVINVLFGGSEREKIAQWFTDRFGRPNPRLTKIPYILANDEQAFELIN